MLNILDNFLIVIFLRKFGTFWKKTHNLVSK